MALMKLAAGIAVGYVLGARAGREKYEQIAATARKVSAHPAVGQAQGKAKELVGVSGSGPAAKPDVAAVPEKPVSTPAVLDEPVTTPATPPSTPRTPRRKPTPATIATPPASQPPLS